MACHGQNLRKGSGVRRANAAGHVGSIRAIFERCKCNVGSPSRRTQIFFGGVHGGGVLSWSSAPADHGREHGGAWKGGGRMGGDSPPPRSVSNPHAHARTSMSRTPPRMAPDAQPPRRCPRRRRRADLAPVSRVGGTRPMHAPSARCTRTWRHPRKSNRNARHGHCARYTPTHHTPYQRVVYLHHANWNEAIIGKA